MIFKQAHLIGFGAIDQQALYLSVCSGKKLKKSPPIIALSPDYIAQNQKSILFIQ
jgi:hypothetical protein